MDRERHLAVSPTGAMLQSDKSTYLDVLATIRIEAECWRVYSALSIPEYMDSWLEVPEGARVAFSHDSQNNIRINLKCSGASRSIYSSRIRTKPGRVTFLWETVERNGSSTSEVDIVLRDGPRRCTLRLRHTGLRSWDENELYSTMWSKSLMRLQSLMQPISASLQTREQFGDNGSL
jgi:uncharacterized protein YndB with AHSA1/START domain